MLAMCNGTSAVSLADLPVELIEAIGYELEWRDWNSVRNSCRTLRKRMPQHPVLSWQSYKYSCLQFLDLGLDPGNYMRLKPSESREPFLFLVAIGATQEVLRWLQNPVVLQSYTVDVYDLALKLAQGDAEYEDSMFFFDDSTDYDSFEDYLFGYHEPIALALMQRLLTFPDAAFGGSSCHQICFHRACRRGDVELVRLLLEHPLVWTDNNGYAPEDLDDIDINFTFSICAEEGLLEIVKILMATGKADPSDDANYAIRLASENGHSEIVDVLLTDRRVDPSVMDNHAIYYAALEGHRQTVEILMKDSRVNPADSQNRTFARACQRVENLDILKLLLTDPRVDPKECEAEALENAAANDCVEILEFLLDDLKLNASVCADRALYTACQSGHELCVKILLDRNSNPANPENPSIIPASKVGNPSVFKMIYADQRVDVSIRDSYAWRAAVHYGWKEIAQILIKDDRINLSVRNHVAFPKILQHGWVEMEKLYLRKCDATRKDLDRYWVSDDDSFSGSEDSDEGSWISDNTEDFESDDDMSVVSDDSDLS
ncbi:hypothetical protein HDU91_005427 [Kappamyces sp. JEL0680]|nr:hypothetical protein HDU91_005427 [Kappamyces sp. JEL0680]